MTVQTQDWLGGIALESIPQNIFETYERSMVPAVFEPWARRLLDHASLKPGERVLDVACATGIVARLAAERVGSGGSVTGLDLLPGMLDVAREASSKVTPPIEWVEGDATSMPLPDEAFDVSLCQQGFQFFPDKIAALGEMRRTLVDGGRLLISVWRSIDRSPAVATLQRAIETHAPEAAGFLPMAFSLTEGDDLRRLTSDAGLADVSLHIDIGSVRFSSVGEYLATYLGATPVGGVISALPRERQAALAAEVVESLAGYTDDEGLTFPQETHVISARRR